MSLHKKMLCRMVDKYFSLKKQSLPEKEKLDNCKIISHRGEHDNFSVIENTITAFDEALDNSVWGIEFDIRWTKDLYPVVFHDVDCRRIFNSANRIKDLTLIELHSMFQEIPTLEDVVRRYGRKIHLMVELKKENYIEPIFQIKRLGEIFSRLRAKIDFHFLSLNPEMFNMLHFVPRSACLPVAETNVSELSRCSVDNGYGGLTGHYLLLNDNIMILHASKGQKIGTGMIASENCLRREINRGVEWIFSNHAVELQKQLQQWR